MWYYLVKVTKTQLMVMKKFILNSSGDISASSNTLLSNLESFIESSLISKGNSPDLCHKFDIDSTIKQLSRKLNFIEDSDLHHDSDGDYTELSYSLVHNNDTFYLVNADIESDIFKQIVNGTLSIYTGNVDSTACAALSELSYSEISGTEIEVSLFDRNCKIIQQTLTLTFK